MRGIKRLIKVSLKLFKILSEISASVMKRKITFLSCIFVVMFQGISFAQELRYSLNIENIIGVKYGTPKISKNENSVYILNRPFYLVIEPPMPGDIEIYLNSSSLTDKKALKKGSLAYTASNDDFVKKIFFPGKGEGIILKKHLLMRVDLVISNQQDKVTYTRFFETEKKERKEVDYFIYLGSFESKSSAQKFKEIVKTSNGDVLALRDFEIIKEYKSNKEVYTLHLNGLSSLSVASSICSILMAREVSCLVRERK